MICNGAVGATVPIPTRSVNVLTARIVPVADALSTRNACDELIVGCMSVFPVEATENIVVPVELAIVRRLFVDPDVPTTVKRAVGVSDAMPRLPVSVEISQVLYLKFTIPVGSPSMR